MSEDTRATERAAQRTGRTLTVRNGEMDRHSNMDTSNDDLIDALIITLSMLQEAAETPTALKDYEREGILVFSRQLVAYAIKRQNELIEQRLKPDHGWRDIASAEMPPTVAPPAGLNVEDNDAT